MTSADGAAREHLGDPLDYLYEELPADAMAEARRHLAGCPACREKIRRIRETVKAYRWAPRPVPPPELAARTAAAVEAARGPATTADGTSAGNADPAAEMAFARLKEEIMGEMRTGWRSWLFHPAWTVAASVLLACAALIHVSPRRVVWEEEPPRPALPEPSTRKRLIAARPGIDHLPPAAEKRPAATASARPAPPSLGDSGVLNRSLPGEMKEVAAGEPVPEADSRAVMPSFQDFMNAAGAGEPPRLLELESPLDRQELALDLATLAGMHIGAGELAEAWEAVRKLRAYASAKADELTGVLVSLEAAEPAVANVSSEPIPDKYFTSGDSPSPPAERTVQPVPAENPAPEPVLPAPAAISETDTEDADSGLSPAENTGAFDAPAPDVNATNGGEPPEDDWPEPGPSIGPDVPKAYPDAIPPTLWESSGRTGRFQLFFSPTPERRTVNRFSTDPYFRGD